MAMVPQNLLYNNNIEHYYQSTAALGRGLKQDVVVSGREMAQKHIKVVVVGDGSVGKSCLLDTLTVTGAVDWDDPHYEPTVAQNLIKEWESAEQGVSFEVEMWDTAGQEALNYLRVPAYANTHVFVLAYDMTEPSSLENVLNWYDEIRDSCDDYCGAILAGTKYDLWREMLLAGRREELVDIRRVEQIAKEVNVSFNLLTSAKTGYGLIGVDQDTYDDEQEPAHEELSQMILQLFIDGGSPGPKPPQPSAPVVRKSPVARSDLDGRSAWIFGEADVNDSGDLDRDELVNFFGGSSTTMLNRLKADANGIVDRAQWDKFVRKLRKSRGDSVLEGFLTFCEETIEGKAPAAELDVAKPKPKSASEKMIYRQELKREEARRLKLQLQKR